ncbi:hypothetical protein FB45DRAFT_428352 [Roridomyces roridus]|uniref:Uncharacterized protein n=1 Tax=Roridomyces roridus TaxID=1738132 RepID=A0AAD7C5X9_9AGAR|nr:hypothetical protein FB45DRAFT_428352 [Roridomyces roridus]
MQTEFIPGSDSRFIIVNLQQPRIIRTEAEFSDSSVLDGITSVGGFWTFVDGIFTVLFGANVLYFAMGSRPLSALGLVHVFQRSQLVRNWNDDFPALRTEGGSPGSKSAGVVAFLRERLVNIEDVSVPPTAKAAKPSQGDAEFGPTSEDKGAEEALAENDNVSMPLLPG